jgi:hypothetical protein
MSAQSSNSDRNKALFIAIFVHLIFLLVFKIQTEDYSEKIISLKHIRFLDASRIGLSSTDLNSLMQYGNPRAIIDPNLSYSINKKVLPTDHKPLPNVILPEIKELPKPPEIKLDTPNLNLTANYSESMATTPINLFKRDLPKVSYPYAITGSDKINNFVFSGKKITGLGYKSSTLYSLTWDKGELKSVMIISSSGVKAADSYGYRLVWENFMRKTISGQSSIRIYWSKEQ